MHVLSHTAAGNYKSKSRLVRVVALDLPWGCSILTRYYTRAEVIYRLGWGWRLCFRDGTLAWLEPQFHWTPWFSPLGCLSVLTAWQLAFLEGWFSRARQKPQSCLWPSLGHYVVHHGFCRVLLVIHISPDSVGEFAQGHECQLTEICEDTLGGWLPHCGHCKGPHLWPSSVCVSWMSLPSSASYIAFSYEFNVWKWTFIVFFN